MTHSPTGGAWRRPTRRPRWPLALALAAALPTPLSGGEADNGAPQRQPAARAMKTAEEAPSGRAGAEALDDAAFNARIRAVARDAFVTVHVTFRKDPAELQPPAPYHARYEDQGPEDLAREIAHRFVDDCRTLDLPGLWIDAAGTVLVTDLGFPTKLIDRIEVRTGDGKTIAAEPHAVLRDAPGWRLAARATGPCPAPAFADPGPVTPDMELTASWIEEIDGVWSISFGPLGGATLPLSGAPHPAWFRLGGGGGAPLPPPGPWGEVGNATGLTDRPLHLLFDHNAVPVGVALHERLPLAPEAPATWRGPAVQHGPAVTFEALRTLERKVIEAADRQVAEVKLTFRMTAPEDDADYRPRGSAPYLRDPFASPEEGRERTVYGLAVAPRRLLVPLGLNESLAARIERIDVALPGRESFVPGRFLGAFKAFAGFLVETDQDLAEPPPDLFAIEILPRVRPIATLRVVHKYGRRTSVFGYARILERQRGYRNRLADLPEPPLAPGTLLFDLDGRPAGFVATLRRDDEKVRALRDPDRGAYTAPWESGLHAEDNRLFRFRDIRDALEHPETAFDPDIRVKTKFEERRLVWLGIEYCLLNRELTRHLGIENPTKSGQIGVMIVDVYDGSPASRLGLRDGDILLAVREAGGQEPVELRFHEGDHAGFGMRYVGSAPPPESEEELWLAEPPWHSQRTPLNLLLTSIGKGKPVILTCLVGGKVIEKELVLEEGPPDYESTDRKKHEPTGLTVRGLTYEVRKALKLPPEAPGVVVSKVEEGSPAAVAKIHPYDVIQRVQGTAVDSPAGLVAAFESACAAGINTVKVQTLRLDRTRFVDLRFDMEVPAERIGKPGSEN